MRLPFSFPFPRLLFSLPAFRLPRSSRDISLFSSGKNEQERPVRRAVFLALYGLVVFSLLLGSRLGSDRFAQLLRGGLPPETGLTLAADGVEPLAFPPGASAKSMTLGRMGKGPLFTLTDVTVRVSLWSLITGRLGVNVAALVGDGGLDATLTSGFLYDVSAASVSADLADLPLSAVPAATALDPGLKGSLSGSLSLAADLATPLAGSLDTDITATGLEVKNFIPLLSPQRLPILDVRLQAEADDGALTVETFSATGKDFAVNARGKADIDQGKPEETSLDFDASVAMPASLVIKELIRAVDYKRLERGSELNVHLSGTLARPRLDGR